MKKNSTTIYIMLLFSNFVTLHSVFAQFFSSIAISNFDWLFRRELPSQGFLCNRRKMQLMVFLSIAINSFCFGQQQVRNEKISVDDTINSVNFNCSFPVTNLAKKQKTISLNQYKDKLIILDFMNSGCPSCIAKIPKIDSLQNKYNKLQVILVSPEKKEKSIEFFSKNAIGKLTKVPMIYGDTVLKKMFPHIFISHLVWIKNRKILAITSTKELNEKNINAVVSGETINLPIKQDVFKKSKNN